ncbi:MAG: hypothetical protein GW938_10005 [Leptospira sp.]|nr:hypothetical protein [Leptospira sp.]
MKTVKIKHIIFLKLFTLFIIFLQSNCEPQGGKSLEEKITDPTQIEFLIFARFYLPQPDACPPPDQIPILEPGIHNINLEEGQSYIFDNRARLDMINITDALTKRFIFKFQENNGQDVSLTRLTCIAGGELDGSGDSGLSSQIESITLVLSSPSNASRYLFYVKLLSINGSGNIQLTTPSTFIQ